MAIPIRTLADLHEYVRGLQANSLHHAQGMLEVFPKVLIAAIGRMDPDTLEVEERNGQAKNAAWCSINGFRFYFTHDHSGTVLVKAGNKQGSLVESFDIGDTFEEVSARIAILGRSKVTAAVP